MLTPVPCAVGGGVDCPVEGYTAEYGGAAAAARTANASGALVGCTLVNSTVLVAGRWFGRVHGLIIVPNHLKPPPTGPQEDTTACNYSFNTTRLVSSGPPLQFQNHIELVLRWRRPIDMPIEQFQNHFELVARGRGPVYPPGIERARGERPVCSFKTTSCASGFEMDGWLVSKGF